MKEAEEGGRRESTYKCLHCTQCTDEAGELRTQNGSTVGLYTLYLLTYKVRDVSKTRLAGDEAGLGAHCLERPSSACITAL